MADGSVSTLTNPVTGTGTTNYVPKWTGASALGDSLMVSNSTGIGIGISNPTNRLYVQGQDSSNLYDNIIAVFRGAGTGTTNYAEVYISNDAYDTLVLGSIGSNYSGSSWEGARYIYAATGDLTHSMLVDQEDLTVLELMVMFIFQVMQVEGVLLILIIDKE
jgi:hypothetical protein